MPFVVAEVQDSQQQVLSVSSWSLAFRTQGTAALRIVLQLLTAAGGSLYGEFVILNLWMRQQRFPAFGNQTFQSQAPKEN